MVSNPAEYKWSSYPAFISKQKKPQLLQTDWLLADFGKNKREAKRNYKDFVEGADLKALEAVTKAVCEEFNCDIEKIIIKGRKKNKAREVAIYIARDMSGLSCKALGDYFSGVSGALITIMHKRVSGEAAKKSRFKRRIDKLKKRILNI